MKQRVYVETSVISVAAGRRPSDLIQLARYEETVEWWHKQIDVFEFVISPSVMYEIEKGDSFAAMARIKLVSELIILGSHDRIEAIARDFLLKSALPDKAWLDAMHLATAAFHGVNYLVSWNCRHIANATMRPLINQVCRAAGCEPPVICTPTELFYK